MNVVMLLNIYIISALIQLQCSYCLDKILHRVEILHYLFFLIAPGIRVMCKFLFSLTLGVLLDMSLLFGTTIKQAAVNKVDDSHGNSLHKTFTPFLISPLKIIRSYFMQTNGYTLSTILLLISQ